MLRTLCFTAVAAAALFAVALASAQTQAEKARIPIMVVGIAHFTAKNDVYNSHFRDLRSRDSQRQIVGIVRRLAAFHPTKVLIEEPYGDSKYEKQYREYLRGAFVLGSNEIYQIDFRLAAASKNPAVYPIDARGFPFGYDGVQRFASAHGQQGILAAAAAEIHPLIARSGALERSGKLLDLLRYINTPAAIDASAAAYTYLDRIGAGKTQPGADLVSYWYSRNLHIFANIRQSVRPGDRVVVVMGQGHAYMLRELIAISPDMQFVDPETYLR